MGGKGEGLVSYSYGGTISFTCRVCIHIRGLVSLGLGLGVSPSHENVSTEFWNWNFGVFVLKAFDTKPSPSDCKALEKGCPMATLLCRKLSGCKLFSPQTGGKRSGIFGPAGLLPGWILTQTGVRSPEFCLGAEHKVQDHSVCHRIFFYYNLHM